MSPVREIGTECALATARPVSRSTATSVNPGRNSSKWR